MCEISASSINSRNVDILSDAGVHKVVWHKPIRTQAFQVIADFKVYKVLPVILWALLLESNTRITEVNFYDQLINLAPQIFALKGAGLYGTSVEVAYVYCSAKCSFGEPA